jgi:uncharacterized phage protein gp47/JayE
MAWARPSLQTILQRIQSDIDSRLAGADSFILRSLLYVIARAVAAVVHGLYGHQVWMSRQMIPGEDNDRDILDQHAAWWDVPRNGEAAATGNTTFTGTDGSVIEAGKLLQRSDGIEYTTDAEAIIASGIATVAVTATTGGQLTNAGAGQSLTLVSPIAGVQSSATVAAGGLTGGTDAEGDPSLLQRLRERVQATPQGGAIGDYTLWAKQIAGVTRVWPMPLWNGASTVGVYFTRDDDAGIIPDAGEVATVQAHIDTLRPVTANVTVYAPTAVPVDMTIQLNPNTSTVQAAVEAELLDLFRREAQVEDGAGSGTVLLSHVREAISVAIGENNHVLTTPVADITLSPGELATLGTITWLTL